VGVPSDNAPGSSLVVGRGTVFALFGADAIGVPSLVGRALAEAEGEAEIAGLKVRQGGAPEHSSEQAQGKIVRQQPTPGTSGSKDSVVYVWISAGPAPVLVPDVKGLTQQRAIDTLRSAGLEVIVIKQETAGHIPGEVYDQYPRAEIEVRVGDTVEIMVAVAPPTRRPKNRVGGPGTGGVSTAGFRRELCTPLVTATSRQGSRSPRSPWGRRGLRITVFLMLPVSQRDIR